jgi:hypothetical protein
MLCSERQFVAVVGSVAAIFKLRMLYIYHPGLTYAIIGCNVRVLVPGVLGRLDPWVLGFTPGIRYSPVRQVGSRDRIRCPGTGKGSPDRHTTTRPARPLGPLDRRWVARHAHLR